MQFLLYNYLTFNTEAIKLLMHKITQNTSWGEANKSLNNGNNGLRFSQMEHTVTQTGSQPTIPTRSN